MRQAVLVLSTTATVRHVWIECFFLVSSLVTALCRLLLTQPTPHYRKTGVATKLFFVVQTDSLEEHRVRVRE